MKNLEMKVVEAMNGQAAVTAIMENIEANQGKYCDYSLICMDCNMPILDGYEASLQIRTYIHSKGLL